LTGLEWADGSARRIYRSPLRHTASEGEGPHHGTLALPAFAECVKPNGTRRFTDGFPSQTPDAQPARFDVDVHYEQLCRAARHCNHEAGHGYKFSR
jgi:hypothetical protein